MITRKHNLRFLIVVFVLLVGITSKTATEQNGDLFMSKTEIKIPNKKKKVKRQKSVQQSLSLLQAHLPEYGVDVLEEANLNGSSHRMFHITNISALDVSENAFSISSFRTNLIQNILNWLGTPYRYGGRGMNGVDCSGFTSSVINETIGDKVLVGSSRNQAKIVRKIFSKDSLRLGDLLFFSKTKFSKTINHVAIYLGNNIFAHSSTHRGVIASELTNRYQERFRFGGRLRYQWGYASL